MYIIEIIAKENTALPDGPKIWTGSDEDYKTLSSGLAFAKEWIEKSYTPDDYEIKYRIVGCL